MCEIRNHIETQHKHTHFKPIKLKRNNADEVEIYQHKIHTHIRTLPHAENELERKSTSNKKRILIHIALLP